MVYIFIITVFTLFYLIESGNWTKLFIAPKSTSLGRLIAPVSLLFPILFHYLQNRPFSFDLLLYLKVVSVVTIEDLLFQGVPLLFLSCERKTYFYLSIMYGLYGLILLRSFHVFILQFLIRYFYCYVNRQYSFVGTTLFRSAFNLLIL